MTATADKLIVDTNKRYGEHALMYATDMPTPPAVHSGSYALDYAMGIGGLPCNRLIEVFGQESCGKTTLGLLSMRQFLDAYPDRHAMVLDLEHKLDKPWMIRLVGAEYMGRILYAQPDHVEMATNMYVDLVGTGDVSFCLFDSVGGAATKASMEKDAEKVQVGGNAPQITKFARLAGTFSAKYECLTYCVNQIRDDMDGYHRNLSPGGRALKHHAIARIYVRKSTRDIATIPIPNSDGKRLTVGSKIFATMVKNQTGGREGMVAEWWFYPVETPEYGFGIDTAEEIFDLALATEVITGSGWYTHPALPPDKKGEHKIQGKDTLKALFRTDESLRATIISETMAALKSKPDVFEIDEQAVKAAQ
jgi:recombination protein RecA